MKTLFPVDEQSLRKILVDSQSEAARGRLDYIEAKQLLSHYISKMGVSRVHPSMLPTQASGRWSTTNPPLVNFPKPYRNMVVPDVGRKWFKFDLDAIEAKAASMYSHDTRDIQLFRDGLDIHTITTCQMFGWPEPPLLTKQGIGYRPECQPWRELHHWGYTCRLDALMVGQEAARAHQENRETWGTARGCEYVGHSDDRRRVLAKTARYAMTYSFGAGVEQQAKAILNAKDAEKLGLTKKQLVEGGILYLRAKPKLLAWKRKTWAECLRTKEARTAFGYRRRLFGKPHDIQKEGLNHMIQGWVAGVMDRILIQLLGAPPLIPAKYPQAWLGYQSHDGAILSFPRDFSDSDGILEVVEQEWEVDGERLPSTSEWGWVYPPDEDP